MARDTVRGMDEKWLKNLYGIAPEPDGVFYLSVEPAELVQRNLSKTATLDYWESGLDFGLSRDVFDSFLKYQTATGHVSKNCKRRTTLTLWTRINRWIPSPRNCGKKIAAILEEK